jgi:hypothetical protein
LVSLSEIDMSNNNNSKHSITIVRTTKASEAQWSVRALLSARMSYGVLRQSRIPVSFTLKGSR